MPSWPTEILPNFLFSTNQTDLRTLTELARRAGVGVLRELARRRALDTELKRVPSRPVAVDLGLAGELHAALFKRVGADVSIAFNTVIPEIDGFVDPARNRQRDLAVALASRRGFEFSNALFEISAAIAAKISCVGLPRTANAPNTAATAQLATRDFKTDVIGAPLSNGGNGSRRNPAHFH